MLNNRRHGFDKNGESDHADEMVDLKPKIKDLITQMQQEPTRDNNPTRGKKSSRMQKIDVEEEQQGHYLDESLLPRFRDSLEYDDEYDDTYDQLNVGMTEPDNVECKPLNQKKYQATADVEEDDEEEEETNQGVKKLDLYEDPAIVRERMARRRETQHQNHHRRGPGPPPSHDVVGKLTDDALYRLDTLLLSHKIIYYTKEIRQMCQSSVLIILFSLL